MYAGHIGIAIAATARRPDVPVAVFIGARPQVTRPMLILLLASQAFFSLFISAGANSR